jgi:malate dehydrogenase (oxaloacetate-decarboxylating)
MPVMEGKCALFKEFAGVDAFPLALDTTDTDAIVETVSHLATPFGGINLEDIAAPRCFEIERRLRELLDIPVFHDDQHGTAIVTLAPLINALRLVGKDPGDLKVVFSGVGASGVAVSKIFIDYGVGNLIGCDRSGAIYKGRTENMNFMKQWYADHTNPNGERGLLTEVIEGADVFVGLSAPGMLTVPMVKKMNRDAVVFAMANPIPEIMPEEAAPHVRIMATGRSDYPNQINNVLAFPGVFRGALDSRATTINDEMKRAAAYAIAGVIPLNELHEDYIIPSVFNKEVVTAVAQAVAKAAHETGVARRESKG